MSASSAPRPIAVQLSEALDRYQHDFDEMVESWVDTAHYREVTRELQDIRMMKGGLPQVSGEMADVMIRHVEVVQAVWNAQLKSGRGMPQEMERLRQRHLAAVEAMRRKCLLLSGNGDQRGSPGP